MNVRQLREISEELQRLRTRGGVGYRELETVASRLGRIRRGGESGSHGQWVSRFPTLRPVTIARHSGDMKRGTKNAILNALEDDVILWEPEIAEQDKRN
jgi:hypothetical protein